ncbi:MAG TPA: MFS transporter [Steroidobacteraceae bacterium]|nr:MFS transporter [Steroidobacteraceae bacterium]
MYPQDVSPGTDRAVPAAARGLLVLTLINLFNYLDRYVPAALLPDLKGAGMGLSDLQLGSLMTGFLVVYMLAAPVFGAIGDRGSRTRPIAVGIALWSLATACSGLARNYLQLLAARAAVGIGEAAYGTIAPALLADYFPRVRRGRVFALFFMAIPVGSALGYVVGGLAGHAFGWRAAFMVAGLPGLGLAAWALGIPDPPRGRQDPGEPAAPPANIAATYLGLLRRAPYLFTVLGYAAYTFAVGGLAFWMPTFLQRVRGVPATAATTGFGAIVVVTGFLGTFAGGWLGDWGLKRSREAYLWLSAAATLLAVPLACVALLATTPAAYYAAIIAAQLLLFLSTGPVNSAIVNLVSPAERASAVALSIFAIHVLGDVISPSLIGAISDRSSLGQAVLLVPAAVAVSGLLWVAAAVSSARRRSRT